MSGRLPDAHFIGQTETDLSKLAHEIDPDDEELEETPPDVIAMLGFDPKEFNQEPADA